MNRVFLSVDSDNAYFSAKDVGFSIDPMKLRKFVERYGELIQWRYYISTYADMSEGKAKFIKALMHLGYSVVQKHVKAIRQEDGTIKYKSPLDIKIVIDALLMADQYDVFVLVSGDSDFLDLINVLQSQGKRVIVISSDHMVATEIREAVGNDYVNLAVIRNEVKRDNGETD